MTTTTEWKIGDAIARPSEPPIGTEMDCRDEMGPFQMKRDTDGWIIVGGRLHYTWKTVVDLWLPATITKVGEGS